MQKYSPPILLMVPRCLAAASGRGSDSDGCDAYHEAFCSRQWPEVYDLCHTFLHVARVRKHTDMRELHVFRVQFSHVRVFSDLRAIIACPCVF